MLSSRRIHWTGLGLAVLAIGAAVGVAFVLRLADPLSSPVIPAEDPYTHMALVREHLRTGSLEPLYTNGGLYPPGLHALLATVWSYSGVDLYQIVLLGPVFFGAIGVLGIALLLARNGGPLAGFVAALALAVAPEAIFRTNMMSPTALDLALLPFLLLALLEMLKGKLAWLGVAAPMSLFFVFSHPWLFPILAMTGLAFVLLGLLFPWDAKQHAPLSWTGIAGALACIGGGSGLMLSTCGGLCGPGLRDIMTLPEGGFYTVVPMLILAVSVAPVLFLASPRLRAKVEGWKPGRPRKLWARLVASAVLAVTLYAVTTPALAHGLPQYVDLPKMVGWPILVMSFAALVALPFLSSPAAYAGAGLFAATYPFVIYNPLHSEFWPHRTAVFLGLSLAILCGVLAGGLADLVQHAWTAYIERRARKAVAKPGPAHKPHPGSHVLLLLAVMAVPVALGGAVWAGTPDGYEGGWYRLYPACEMDALREIAGTVDRDPNTLVMTGDWESKLVIASLSSDASRVAFKQTFFTLEKSRADTIAQMQHQGRTLVVVVDRYLKTDNPDAQTDFLDQAPFHPLGPGTWCGNNGTGQSRLFAYTTADSPGGPA